MSKKLKEPVKNDPEEIRKQMEFLKNPWGKSDPKSPSLLQRAGCLNNVILEPGPMVILGVGRNSGKTERMKFAKKIMEGGELILKNMQIGDFSGMIEGDEILQKNRILENLWQKLGLMDLDQLREISEKIKEYELEHKKI